MDWILFFLVTGWIKGSVCDDTDKYCTNENECNSQQADKPILFHRHHDDPTDGVFHDINNLPPLDSPRYLINKHPQIIWWYPDVYPHGENKDVTCSLGTCTVTTNRNELKNPLTRGIIFYGTSFRADDLPLPRLPHHEWALIHEESPKNNWMFSSEVGMSLFNHTATFRRESDYPLSTQFIKDPNEWLDETFFVSTEEKNRLQREEGLAPAVYLQRDCNPPSDRDTYVKELMKYIDIDSYGACVNNKKIPEEIDGFHKLADNAYYHFLAKYKFQIAFENCLCDDYMTEKVFRPLQIGSVPVYLGSSKIRDFMPTEKSVIVVNDFKTPKDLADYLKELNSDDKKYNEYLKHHETGVFTNPEFQKSIERQKWKLPSVHHKANFGFYMFSGFSCHICDKLHERNNRLRKHLADFSVPVLPTRTADSSHMGCPAPKPILPNSVRSKMSIVHDYGRHEAIALIEMLLANETDTNNWKNYLKVNTDKYP